MNTVLVTAPVELPVSLAEMKNLLKIETSVTEDDALTLSLIKAAVEHAETYQNRRFITQTWDLKLEDFPCGPIWVPFGTLQSVTSIAYVDPNGNTQTWASTYYEVDTSGVLGKIQPVEGQTYPSTRETFNAVTIRFVCGYGTAAASVPETTRLAIQLTVKEWYDKRGEGTNLETVERLLYPQRIEGL